MLKNLISLIFPQLCAACDNILTKGEEIICTYCRYLLPETMFHKDADNAAAQKFWGRIKIEAVGSLYFFDKGGRVQSLIHRLKYRNEPEVGIFLGEIYSKQLKENIKYSESDIIIPVPLHAKKEFRRGYNQSEFFAKGISKGLDVPVGIKVLIRERVAESQTRKGRYQRWQNVSTLFKVKKPEAIKDKKILLVDDVITTGSTLEACAEKLMGAGAHSIKIATIAYAH